MLKINPPVTMSGWMISFLIVVTEVYVIMVRLIFLISAPPFYPTILAPGALKGTNTVSTKPEANKTKSVKLNGHLSNF